jgi:protein transport protein SEC24
MKSIPLRPDLSTPADFRGFYMYMLSNSSPKIVELMMYPLLLNITADNAPLSLSLASIDQNSIFILDTGVNLFFYIGKAVDQEITASLFEDMTSGPFLYQPPENEFSNYVSELLLFLLENRVVKPRYILVNGNETSVYCDIFFSYMYDDRMYQLPSASEFRNTLDSKK